MSLFMHSGERKFSFTSLMNFVDFTVYNAGSASRDNINAGGVDVAAGASVTATLTAAEILAVAQLDGVFVTQVSASAAEKLDMANLLFDDAGADDLLDAVEAAEEGGNTLLRERAWAALRAEIV